jgi:hypothetical protein
MVWIFDCLLAYSLILFRLLRFYIICNIFYIIFLYNVRENVYSSGDCYSLAVSGPPDHWNWRIIRKNVFSFPFSTSSDVLLGVRCRTMYCVACMLQYFVLCMHQAREGGRFTTRLEVPEPCFCMCGTMKNKTRDNTVLLVLQNHAV